MLRGMRKGELSKSMLDRQWPYQVAIDAEHTSGRAHALAVEFCKPLSLAPRGHSYVENDRWVNVYCFREREHADAFAAEYGGRIVNPADRPRWPGKRRRR